MIADFTTQIRSLPVSRQASPQDVREQLEASFDFTIPVPLPELTSRVASFLKANIVHVTHPRFGFRLTRPEDISKALHAVESAGGRILSHGEFCPGEPYLCCEDPDGYEVEIWYELPTPIDPKPPSERGRAASRRSKRDPRRSRTRT